MVDVYNRTVDADGTVYLSNMAVEHPAAPLHKDAVRARHLFSGWRLRPTAEGHTLATYVRRSTLMA